MPNAKESVLKFNLNDKSNYFKKNKINFMKSVTYQKKQSPYIKLATIT